MRILLATYEYPPDRGGVAAYLGGLFGALPDVRVLKLKMPTRPLGWIWNLPKLWWAARGCDAVAVSHVLPLGTSAAMLGKPYAVIVHGLDLRNAASVPRKKEIAARVLAGAKLLVANSRATAMELSSFGIDPSKARVITPCPDAELTEAGKAVDARKTLDLEGKRVLLSVGRFVPRKGFDRLIRLLPQLRAACGDVVLVVAGVGREEARLRSEAALSGVEPYVRFVIAPDRDTLASLYRAADVFALAVRASEGDVEGFGIVFLEAALFGLPVVATRTGGVPEAVVHGATGLLADPDSESEVYDALKRLLDDRALAERFGAAGRERVTRDFRWDDRAGLFLKGLA